MITHSRGEIDSTENEIDWKKSPMAFFSSKWTRIVDHFLLAILKVSILFSTFCTVFRNVHCESTTKNTFSINSDVSLWSFNRLSQCMTFFTYTGYCFYERNSRKNGQIVDFKSKVTYTLNTQHKTDGENVRLSTHKNKRFAFTSSFIRRGYFAAVAFGCVHETESAPSQSAIGDLYILTSKTLRMNWIIWTNFAFHCGKRQVTHKHIHSTAAAVQSTLAKPSSNTNTQTPFSIIEKKRRRRFY